MMNTCCQIKLNHEGHDGENTIANTRGACARRSSRNFLNDGDDGSGFDRRRLGLVGNQLAQERN